MRVRLQRAASFLIATWLSSLVSPTHAAEQPPDTMEARLLACVVCHGEHGEGTSNDYFPRLAGKPAGYLYNQLVAFHEDRRRYSPMNYLLEFLDEDYLHAMAAHYATERPIPLPPTPPVVSEEVLERGRQLVTSGDSAHGIPPCSHCHGPSLTGMEPGIPGLVGLRVKYVIAQLGAWRYGTRTAIAPDCMQIVAGHLTEADVTAVAAYLSSLSDPADPSPLKRGALEMPLACGSEPQ